MSGARLQFEGGFSLIELIVTIALVAVLMSLALPAMQTTTRKNQVNTEVNRLIGELLYARNQAVTRSRVVTLCRSTDAVGCGGGASGRYDSGWMTYAAPAPRVAYSNSGSFELLRVGEGASTKIEIRSSGAQAPTFISYLPSGRVDPVVAGPIVLTVCYSGVSTVQVPGKRITITVSGKPSVSEMTPSNC